MSDSTTRRDGKFPVTIKRGSAQVKIYRTVSHGCELFVLSFYQDGKRIRPSFSNFEEARDEAEILANRLGSTDAAVLKLTGADLSAYQRARQHLDPLGVAIEIAAAQFSDAKRKLGSVPLHEAVEFYLKRNPKTIEPHSVESVVEEFISTKAADGLSERYVKSLRWALPKFVRAFRCNIGDVTGPEIDVWLRGVGLSPRTRNNLRNSVQTLFSFAKARRYVPKDHDELDAVPLAKDKGGEIEVFTPFELESLLNCADERLVPFLVLGAFAGIRHAEIQRLNWDDLKLEDDLIEIKAAKAKTASRRTVPILENLKAWLLPYAEASGPVCAYKNVAQQINKLVRDVNANWKAQHLERTFRWKHNGLRHSFISYRIAEIKNVPQVALEAGNSPQIIFSNYRELVRPSDAKKWFSIVPRQAENIIQLDARPNSIAVQGATA